MTTNETNHASDRLNGRSGDHFELTYAPTAEDRRRWLLTDAARIMAAEDARVDAPPEPEE